MSRKNEESPDSRSRGANANFPIKKKLKEDYWPIWLNELLTNTGNVPLAVEEIDNDAQTDWEAHRPCSTARVTEYLIDADRVKQQTERAW
jgi:hypothetical protein